MRTALTATLFLLASNALAQVSFNLIPSEDIEDTAAMSAECDGSTSSTQLTCQFTQVRVSYEVDPNEWEECRGL